MLIVALVMIVVVAVAGTAVLRQQQSSPAVHEAYEEVRTVEITADEAIDAAIESIRYDRLAAVSQTAGGRGRCNNDTAPARLSGVPDTAFTAGGEAIHVYCRTDPTSGALVGSASNVPDAPVLVLGGMKGRGNYSAAPDTVPLGQPTYPPYRSQNIYSWFPFCDDWEAPGSNECEAGLYVGRGVTDGDEGSLRIAGNGALAPDPYLVKSNGAIIVATANDANRRMVVDGGVWARRGCGGYSHTSGTFMSVKDRWNPAGVNGLMGTSTNIESTAGAVDCANVICVYDCAAYPAGHPGTGPGTPSGPPPTPDKFDQSSLLKDPLYVRPPFDLERLCDGTPCIPRVDNANPDPAYRLPTTLCDHGYVPMPARRIGTQDGEAVYAAWYDRAADLNALMESPTCKDTLFWFRPGIYYFDFVDVTGATKWLSPKGCFPTTGTCGPSQIVAGTPRGWAPCKENGIDSGTAAAVDACVQPERVMETNWADWDGSPWQTTRLDGTGAQPTGTGTIDIGDGLIATTSLYPDIDSPAKFSASAKQRELQTPIPQTAGSYVPGSIDKVIFEISYRLDDEAPHTKYEPAAEGNPNLHYGAQVEIRANGGTAATTGSCFMWLRPGDHVRFDPDAVPPQVDRSDPDTWIDLSNGCPFDDPYGRFQKATGMFAANGGSCNWNTRGTCGTFAGWDPRAVNTLRANFFVKTYMSTRAPGVPATLDGMQFAVKWTGRPAPQFPNGCDNTKPGATFMIGGSARIDWGQYQHDTFVEMCASKQDRFPNWTNDPAWTGGALCTAPPPDGAPDPCRARWPGHDLGIAVYAPSEPTAEPARTLRTDALPVKGGDGRCAGVIQSFTEICTDYSIGTGTTLHFDGVLPESYTKVDDGRVARTAAAWNNATNQKISFRLPNVVCSATGAAFPANCGEKIPAGSFITNVQFTLRHREGSFVGGTYYGGGCRSSAPPCTPSMSLRLVLTPGTAGRGSNGYDASSWDASDRVEVNNRQEIPACIGTSVPPAEPAFCEYTFGDPTLPNGVPVNTDYGKPGLPPEAGDWRIQRSLTDAFATPEAISNALVQLEVKVASTDQNPKEAVIDGLVFKVSYRAAGDVRPVRGCGSIRSEFPPSDIVPTVPGDGSRPLPEYHWIDAEWGPRTLLSDQSLRADRPFTDFGNRPGAGNDQDSDKATCAVLAIDTSQSALKAHLQGMIYAPSSALYLTGNDNDAAWTTQGIVARQITAFRWKKGASVPAVGGTPPPRNDRKVTLEARTASGRVLVRALVEFDDLDLASPGYRAKVTSWVKNPS